MTTQENDAAENDWSQDGIVLTFPQRPLPHLQSRLSALDEVFTKAELAELERALHLNGGTILL